MLLADNDVLAKAAHWNLLEAVPRLIAGDWQDVLILDSLRHRAARAAAGKQDRLFASPHVAARLDALIRDLRPLPLASEAVRALLADHVGIDPGEQLLFGALIESPDGMLITGDKRALIALPELLPVEVLAAIQGRSLCTEHLLACAVDLLGIAEVRARMRPYIDRDLAARIIMGAACDRQEAEVRVALASYLNDIRTQSKGIVRD